MALSVGGKRVPFNPKQFPIRLSKRVGLRTMGMAGGKKKPLHPSYVCWYNSCEACADWSLVNGATCALDSVDFKENVGSLNFYLPYVNANPTYAAIGIPSLALGCIVGGFWHKAVATGTYINHRLGFNFQTGSAYIRFYRNGTYTYQLLCSTSSASYAGPKVPLNWPGAWRWIEIYIARGVSSTGFSFRIDGVDIGGPLLNGTVGLFSSFYAMYYNPSVHVDYLRVADRWEYPPA